MRSGKNIAVLVNPAPQGERPKLVAEQIEVLLKGMDIKHKVFDFSWPDRLDDFSEAWVVGGDGTLNFFINQFPELKIPVSIFKAGSGNDFHWMIYGDCTVEEQVEKILEERTSQVDAGICNGRLFLNGIGIGFDGAIVKDLIGKRKIAGKASYLVAIMKNVMSYNEKPCIIQLENETIEQDCFMISVANAKRYGGGFHVAPKAVIDDSLLDVSIIAEISPIKRLRYLPVMEKGVHLELPFVKYRQAASVNISSPFELHAHADGEYFSATNFELEVLPGRFSFLV